MTWIAALPMYDWPETRAQTDAQWTRMRDALLNAGVDAPAMLARTNAALPAIAGGIRDCAGASVAEDPAMLPPDTFDLPTAWRHPALLLGQTCWGPMRAGLAEHVTVVGQQDYTGVEGGQGTFYRSALLMRTPDADEPAPEDDRARLPLERMRGTTLAYNDTDSMSGLIALRQDLEARNEGLGIFSGRIETGSHRASIAAVARAEADICAIDCKSLHLARQFEPAIRSLRVVGWTARRTGLPFITSRHTPPQVIELLRRIVPG